MQPPKLEKRQKKHKFHEKYEIEDDYSYLEDNWQEIVKNPKILPKKIAIKRSLYFAKLAYYPLKFFLVIITPFSFLVNL